MQQVKIYKFLYFLASWRVMSCMWQVTFSARGQVTCQTTQWHKRKQQWREKRDACFLAGNTVIILSFFNNTHTHTHTHIHTQMFDQGPSPARPGLWIVAWHFNLGSGSGRESKLYTCVCPDAHLNLTLILCCNCCIESCFVKNNRLLVSFPEWY